MILKNKDRLCRCCLVVFIYCGLLLGWNVIILYYLNFLIITKMKMTLKFITINTTNFQKLILFECNFINTLFKNKNLLQKCSKLLFYIYFKFLFFMYFRFNNIYSKFLCFYIFIQYFVISLFLIFNFIYFNVYISDNLVLVSNILLENYTIFEDINLDINNNHELNKDFNVLYFNNNKSLIPYNNNGNNNNNMNNMNNMNNRNNSDDMSINEIFNKSKNNQNQESDTDTKTLFNKVIHLKKTNPSIFDMIKKHYSDNNNISPEKSLVKYNTINDNNNNLSFSTDNSKIVSDNKNLSLSNNNLHVDNSKLNNTNTFMKVVNPIFENNSSTEELRMPCRILGPYSHLPIINKTGTMLSLPYYNGTPTALERLNYELNGTLPDDFISVNKNIIKNTITQDGLNIIKLENPSHSNSLSLKNDNLDNNLENLSAPALESSVPQNTITNLVPENAVASSSRIEESSFVQGSSTSNISSDLLLDPLNYLPDDIFLSHILTIKDPNKTDIQPFVGGFDVYGNLHLPVEVLDHYQVPDYMLLNYDCYAQYDSDLHPVRFKGMLEEAWKHGYLDTIIEFYLEDHNMYETHYTKDNMNVIIEYLRDKIIQPNSNTPTIDKLSSFDKGKGKAI